MNTAGLYFQTPFQTHQTPYIAEIKSLSVLGRNLLEIFGNLPKIFFYGITLFSVLTVLEYSHDNR